MRNAILIPHDRERLAPVTLTAKEPVAQAIGCCGAPQSLGFQPLRHRCLCSILIEAIEADFLIGRVDSNTVTGVGALSQIVGRGILSITDRANDIQMETTRKLPVTIIMRRNRHDGASSVIHQHVVSNKDGDTLLVHGVNCPQTSEDTGLLPGIFCALLRGLCGSLCTVSGHCFCRSFIARAPFRASSLRPRCRKFERSLVRGRTGSGSTKEGMLGRPDHEGRSKERIGTCRVNGELAI